MQKIDVNSHEIDEIVEILKVLAHPIRYSIAKTLLENGSMNVKSIQENLDLPQSTVSQHISKMRQLGVVNNNREGTKIFYDIVNPIAINVIKSTVK
ncbi:ArsR/SmtB family transcription factor [Falseniella ignava]|uniref:HTH arsR-type domain-containing protein n=2 Tax=Falseniella ignava TaxID=137730 RepID=K1LTR7_9LACT|nr:metalloregulator ArsR/SmtB family transcription factor [Falseniella ignava]EKB58326.1 hypothetical protein HMPREF9707_00275 [Falseniella ignava CCUG 37419]PKY87568.1 transcriptional regulator [Falseniella ignava]